MSLEIHTQLSFEISFWVFPDLFRMAIEMIWIKDRKCDQKNIISKIHRELFFHEMFKNADKFNILPSALAKLKLVIQVCDIHRSSNWLQMVCNLSHRRH